MNSMLVPSSQSPKEIVERSINKIAFLEFHILGKYILARINF